MKCAGFAKNQIEPANGKLFGPRRRAELS